MSTFISRIEDCIARGGFVTLAGGAEASKLPLFDEANELYARFSLSEARQWCEANGCRLPTVDELRELHDESLWIAPVTLPTAAMVTAAGLPLTTDSINRFRNTNMASKQWATIHDNTVDKELEDAGYDGTQPVANCGKCWTQEGALFGWRNSDGSYIQNPYYGHGDHHHDYATTTYVARDVVPDDDTDPGETLAGRDLGEAVLELATEDLDAGVHEDLGPNDGVRIREYLKPFSLPPPQNWCSVAVAAWLREACERYGMEQPIEGSPGAQATMAQMRAAGLWVEPRDITDSDLTPGAIIVWKRPPASWTGHIGVIESHEDGTITTIEGNAGPMADRVVRNERRLDDPLLLGVGRLDDFEGPPVHDLEFDMDDDCMCEPIHEGSDPLEYDADHLFARWLGLDKLELPEEDGAPAEWVANSTGLDISSWQRPDKMHWDEIDSAHAFVICRATYGIKSDSAFSAHVEAIEATSLILGAYHFVRTSQPWAAQIEAYCSRLDEADYGDDDIMPALDLERNEPYDPWQPSKLLAYAANMAEVLTARFGGCLLYISPSDAAELGQPELLRQHPIWVAHYGVSEPRWPADNPWTIWQSSGSHQGPEATGPLDLNYARSLPRCE